MVPQPEFDEDAIVDLFACGICDDLMVEPTTLSCCGKAFCRLCLRQWIGTSVHTAGIPRCPGGCGARVPVRLPARSRALQHAIEQLAPERLEQRKREAEEDEVVEVCPGGVRPWQEVAANRDIIFGSRLGIRQGTPGVVIGPFSDGCHVTVKFDEQEDGSELCVNVLPEALMVPLPGGFRLGQRIVALYHLMINDAIGVLMGTGGVVVGGHGGNRLTVLFDARLDSRLGPEFPVSVGFREVIAQRPLVGGFRIAQSVQSAMDLIVGNRVVVRAGTRGSVVNEFSDTRLTVAFDISEEDGHSCFNVLPLEIKPWCEPPSDLPVGSRVQAIKDVVGTAAATVRAGTRGTILGGIDATQVLVSFESSEGDGAPQALMVECQAITKAEGAPEAATALVRNAVDTIPDHISAAANPAAANTESGTMDMQFEDCANVHAVA
mmetsp:Transcript_106744/g.211982  ORF Transcript_106744/g.211982 Transcript_106744/m.211982 type:complete len:435 (+) Transcript_106744:70-1374(+)|eukprot:CAMPEP_0172707574 /NCGR_PEP_ID=MMETSP1074-20121228/50038_1 /TAXON_ID=2916 /ORGANISM="Ceratium fusus, Strain PA161109" /LENGTH=434 /DNA_ID=CAMNT_0013530401 /DNA_START=67 /DNA_END=1371 /DNA_ORIENTATION=+